MRDPERFLARLWELDAELVAAGWPAMSPWWKRKIERFIRSGRRRWIARVGRRGGKSSSLCRLAVAVALFGEWHVPHGDIAVIPFVSIDRQEATGRLRTIMEILNVLGVSYATKGDTIELRGRRVAFRVVTCSVGGTVGFTAVAAFADEMARWESRETSANPAREVMGSLRPTMATQEAGFEVCSSSPWGEDDYHAELFAEGDTEDQCADWAPTWEANPTITEEQTRKLEPDERTRNREYGAIPQVGIAENWFDWATDMAFELGPLFEMQKGEENLPIEALAKLEADRAARKVPVLDVRNGMSPIFTVDPAFSKHYFGYAVTTSEPAENDNARRLTLVHTSGAWRPDGEPRNSLERLKDSVLVPYMHKAGLDGQTMYVHTDQAEFYSLRSVAREMGIELLLVPWSGGEGEKSKVAKFKAVRTAMFGNDLRVQSHWANPQGRRRLVAQFRGVSGKLTAHGHESIILREDASGHSDELSACVMGAALALERPAVAAKPVEVVRTRDNPDEWRAKAEREVNEKRAREWKRSPMQVMRRAMR